MTHNTISGYCFFDRGEAVGDIGVIIDGKGKVIGGALIVKRWPIFSYVSTHMCQIEARINGVLYTGRSPGHNMYWNGKIKKEKRAMSTQCVDTVQSQEKRNA